MKFKKIYFIPIWLIIFSLVLFYNHESFFSNDGVIMIENNLTNIDKDADFIIEQMYKNQSKDITNLSNKKELILKNELNEANKRFENLTNNSN